MHIPSSIEAEEAEEIGVEHLLRDIRDTTTVGTLSTRVSSQLSSLRGLQSRLVEIRDYLKAVVNEELPVNHQIIYNLQDIFNLLPDLDGVKKNGLGSTTTTTSLLNGDVNMDGSAAASASGGEDIQDLVENNSRSFSVANNDQLLVIYLSSLIRSVIALHELVNNRMENAKEEGGNEEDQSESKKEKDEKEKEKKDSEKEGEKKKGKK